VDEIDPQACLLALTPKGQESFRGALKHDGSRAGRYGLAQLLELADVKAEALGTEPLRE
jgi:hypothetical protein